MASHYKVNCAAAMVLPANGAAFSLSELQGFVGGYIEFARRLADGRIMFVNEAGRLHSLPFNFGASVLCDLDIVGDAILCSPTEAGEG